MVKLISLEPTNSDGKVKAVATIEIPNIAKIFGIKVMQGGQSFYCVPPTTLYHERGAKKWSNVVIFEKPLWIEIQDMILTEYRSQQKEFERRQ